MNVTKTEAKTSISTVPRVLSWGLIGVGIAALIVFLLKPTALWALALAILGILGAPAVLLWRRWFPRSRHPQIAAEQSRPAELGETSTRTRVLPFQVATLVIGAALIIGPNWTLFQGWFAHASQSAEAPYEPLFTDRHAQQQAVEALANAGPQTSVSNVVLRGTTLEATKIIDQDSPRVSERFRYGVPGLIGKSGIAGIGAGSTATEFDQFQLGNINWAIINPIRTKTIEYFSDAGRLPAGATAAEVRISASTTGQGLKYQVLLDGDEDRSATFDATGDMVSSVPAPDDDELEAQLNLLANAEDFEQATSALQDALDERVATGVSSVFIEQNHITVFVAPPSGSRTGTQLVWRQPQLFGDSGVSAEDRDLGSQLPARDAKLLTIDQSSWKLAREVYQRSLDAAKVPAGEQAEVTRPSVVLMHTIGSDEPLIQVSFDYQKRTYQSQYDLDGKLIHRSDVPRRLNR